MLVWEHSREGLTQLEETVLEELSESKLAARGTLGLAVLEEEKSREYDEEYESRGGRRRRANRGEELKVAHTITFYED